MHNRTPIVSPIVLAIVLPVMASCLVLLARLPVHGAPTADGPAQQETPLTDAQAQALAQRAIENQHHDFEALQQYERTEHEIRHGNGKDVADRDTITRIVPTGTGEYHVVLQRDGKPTSPADLEKEWIGVARQLVVTSAPDDSHDKQRAARKKRNQEEAEMVDTMAKAFVFRWVGRQMENGRSVVQLSFESNPAFHSSLWYVAIYAHTFGSIWIDESEAHLVRLDAQLNADVYYVAGIVAKVYRGGRFIYSQQEVVPGVWVPSQMIANFDGRKFLFSSIAIHSQTDITDYLYLGTPQEALASVRREHPLATGSDP